MDNGRLPERICTKGKSFYNLNTPLLVNYEKNGYQSLLNRRPLDIKTRLLGIIKWALFQYTRAFPPAAVMTVFLYSHNCFCKRGVFPSNPSSTELSFQPTHTDFNKYCVHIYCMPKLLEHYSSSLYSRMGSCSENASRSQGAHDLKVSQNDE